MGDTVKGTKRITSANTMTNAVSHLVEQQVKNLVNTAEVVMINNADQNSTDKPAGYATATPLVCQTDTFNNTLEPAPLHHLPYFRYQAGRSAIVMDPQPNDKAILIAMQKDSTGVVTGKNDTVQPASFRSYDMADGFLITGFLGEAPLTWLKLDPVSGDISLSTDSANIDISCRESGDIEVTTNAGNITIKTASGDITQSATGTSTTKAPQITLDGNVTITGNLSVQGISEGAGGGAFVTKGGIKNTGGEIISNGITLEQHTHTGVYAGKDATGKPQG